MGEIRSNLTIAYFSDGLVQPPTRIAASKKNPSQQTNSHPTLIEVNPTNEHWKPMVFSDIFWWGLRSFRFSCTSKNMNLWPIKLDVISKNDLIVNLSRLMMIFTNLFWLKTSIFLQLQGNETTQGNPNYRHLRSHFGVYFENGKGAGNPEAWHARRLKTNGWDSLSF